MSKIDTEYLAKTLHNAAESLDDLCTRKCHDDRIIAVANAYYYLSEMLMNGNRINSDSGRGIDEWIVKDTLDDFPDISDRIIVDIESDIEKEPVLDEGEVRHRLGVLKERITRVEMSGDLKRYKELFELYTKYEWVLINRRYDYLIKDDTETPEDEDKDSMKKRIEGLAYNICCDMGLGVASNLYEKCIELFSKYTPNFAGGYAIDIEDSATRNGIIAVPSAYGHPIIIPISDEANQSNVSDNDKRSDDSEYSKRNHN